MSDLEALAERHGADKLAHGYCTWYEQHLAALRHKEIRLLEIGVGGYSDPLAGGASLLMWRDYFSAATIVGMDSHEKTLDLGDRVTVVQGSQADRNSLLELEAEFGPFDIVIDDGSHLNVHRNLSFEVLFPRLAEGGIYIMEDLHTSYLREFYRGNNRPQTSSSGEESSMELVKELIDGLNYQYIPNWTPQPFDESIVGISVHPKIAFIQKGSNHLSVNPIDQRAIDAERER